MAGEQPERQRAGGRGACKVPGGLLGFKCSQWDWKLVGADFPACPVTSARNSSPSEGTPRRAARGPGAPADAPARILPGGQQQGPVRNSAEGEPFPLEGIKSTHTHTFLRSRGVPRGQGGQAPDRLAASSLDT